MRSIHPYEPYISDDATKLIIGSMAPYRFCNDKELLNEKDVRFYYGSYKNNFWKLLGEVMKVDLEFKNTDKAIEQRKELLLKNHLGIMDMVKSCIHKDGKSLDKSLMDIEYREIDKILLKYPNINTLICTSRNVLVMLNKFAKLKYKAISDDKRTGMIVINDKEYKVIILYSPSPCALMVLGNDGIIKRKNQYRDVFLEE